MAADANIQNCLSSLLCLLIPRIAHIIIAVELFFVIIRTELFIQISLLDVHLRRSIWVVNLPGKLMRRQFHTPLPRLLSLH